MTRLREMDAQRKRDNIGKRQEGSRRKMIDTISLKHFKAFRELHELPIKPVTILCGTNSCGKSSILQSILLLKQTFDSQNSNQTVLLNGRFAHLGSFDNIVYQKKKSNSVVFDFNMEVQDNVQSPRGRRPVPLSVQFRDFYPEQISRLARIPLKIQYRAEVGVKSRGKLDSVAPVVVNSLLFRSEVKAPDGTTLPGLTISMEHNQGNSYSVSWKGIRSRFLRETRATSDGMDTNGQGTTTAEVEFANLLPIMFREIEERRASGDVIYAVRRLPELLRRAFGSFTYIGPLREEPSRRYIYEDEISEIGIKGENAAYIYLVERDRTISDHYFYNEASNSFELEGSHKLGAAVQQWMSLMNIHALEPEPSGEIIRLNLDSNMSSRTRVSIADVGFGVSQVFPIVLEGLRMSSGSTLLLEQPEIHLHPNLQMQLADYLITLGLSQKGVIVETHSDHIVNRLVRRIVEDTTYNLKDLIGIYFVSPTSDGSTYETVVIDENRGIVNWPIGFFDQTATEQERIIQAGIDRRVAGRLSSRSHQ